MTIRETKKSFISVCLLALFIGYIANNTFFVHTHVVDGQTITHSHPYRGTPDNPGHSHTTAQFQLISHLSLWLTTAVSAVMLALVCSRRWIIRSLWLQPSIEQIYTHSRRLRAPPCSIQRGKVLFIGN